jgi:pyruvate,water dikinase
LGIDPSGLQVLRGADEAVEFDPNPALAEARGWYDQLDSAIRARLACGGPDGPRALCELDPEDPFRRAVDQLVDSFGHLSDSGNDFSAVPWRENVGLVLQTIAGYAPPATENRLGWDDLPLSPLRRRLLRPLYHRARRFRLYREAVSSLYTYGYGLFRLYYLALADRLVARDFLAGRDDVFYLTADEVRSAATGRLSVADGRAAIARRRAEVEAAYDVRPPAILYGDEEVPPDSGPSRSRTALRGTPTSRGVYTGPVRVVRGLGDFNRVRPGDVLVVPFSDVGWTPLFVHAGAVVAESGGLLSHSSIVAREYGIPAVVSVPHACDLEDDTPVTVDGYRGEVAVQMKE